MARRTAIRAVLACILLAALAACSDSSSDKAGPTATVATEPAPTTTIDPYAVPAVIDVAYVNRVLAGLDAAIGDVVRLIIRAKTIPPEAIDRLKVIYVDPASLQLTIDSFQSDMRKGFSNYKTNPGNGTTNVTRLITATSNCIFAEIDRDYTAVGNSPSPTAGREWVALKNVGAEERHYNPTDWAFIYEGFPADRTQPRDPCAA